MTEEKYYGTIINWFSEMHRGSIMPDNLGRRIFADSLSLAAGYLTPKTGDRVRFHINEDRYRPSAYSVEPANTPADAEVASPAPLPLKKAVITLAEWDFMQNGGFGTEADNPGQPVFILGQLLSDQSRVPEAGDQFEGMLFKHADGQLVMADAVLLKAARAADPFRTPSVEADSPKETAAAPAAKAQANASAATPQSAPAPDADRFTDSIYTLHKAPEPQEEENLPVNQTLSGTVISWDDAKGYGFIRFGTKSQNLFFHISAFHYATRRPQIGQSVSFFCKKQLVGERQKAARVVLRGDEKFLFEDFPPDYNRPQLSSANMSTFLTNSLIAAAFAVFVAVHSKILLGAYFVLSVVSYFMYKFDKQTAQTRKKKNQEYQGRIPEKNLHIADVLGGWPGALISRAVYRHKTSKASFIRIFRLTVAVNLAITYALLIHYADNPLLSILRN